MSTTALKILALVLMTIDHVGAFLSGMPIAFRWVGRLSAPVFLFCLLEGIEKTSSRKKYILRLYLFSVGMATMDVIINKLMPEQPILDDDIFLVYFGVVAFVSILDWCKKNHSMKWGILFIILWQVIIPLLLEVLLNVAGVSGFLNLQEERILKQALIGQVVAWSTNTLFVILGVLLFYHKHNKRKFALIYVIMSLVPTFLMRINFFPRFISLVINVMEYKFGFSENVLIMCENVFVIIVQLLGFEAKYIKEVEGLGLWKSDFQWMMIGALPLFWLYSGEKGKGGKLFFYLYYPLHICVLAWMR